MKPNREAVYVDYRTLEIIEIIPFVDPELRWTWIAGQLVVVGLYSGRVLGSWFADNPPPNKPT